MNLVDLIERLALSSINGLRNRTAPNASRLDGNGSSVFLGERVGFLPGTSWVPREVVSVTGEDLRRHVYVVGATGSGKTNLLLGLIEADLIAGRTICLIDLRGDLVDRCLTRVAAMEHRTAWRVCLIDLRDDQNAVGFNPLAGAGDAYARAYYMLGVFKSNSPSWGIQLEETLRNSLIALSEAGYSILEIDPFLANPGFRAHVLSKVTDAYVRTFFQRFEALSPDKQLSWILPVLNKTTPLLAIPRLRAMLGSKTPVNIGRLLDRPGQIILVALAADRLHESAHLIGGLLITSIQNAITARVDQPENRRNQVVLYVDEFGTMAGPAFESIVAEGRRFGSSLVLAHQNLFQVPVGLRHVLRNNVHTQVYFQTGALDATELISEMNLRESKDDLREVLISQPVGEAFLIRRGEETIRMRVRHSPDPSVDPKKARAVRRAALKAFGRPSEEVEQELAQRAAWVESVRQGSQEPKEVQVRHEKRPKQPS